MHNSAMGMATDLVERAIARTKRSWGKYRFDRVAARVLATAPLHLRGDSPLFLSMVCHRDVPAYLLAIKSLYSGVGCGRVTIINDGSLTSSDLAILHNHIQNIEVFDIAAISTGSCPRGGTWERLVKILELTANNYVIQVDADIMVSASVAEVVHCWEENRPFLLGTRAGQQVSPAAATARMVQGWINAYYWDRLPVGVAAEAALDKLLDGKSYVHASSGFAGFAQGAFSLADLQEFSALMSRTLREKQWNEWGSEQIASNYMLANAPGATVLPFPRYACFEPDLEKCDHALLHFIGEHRYNDGIYRRTAAKFIARYKDMRPVPIGTR